MSEPSSDAAADTERISYQTFGENFIRYLVTVPRLRGEIEDALKATVEGSTAALPKDLLVADYQFQPRDLFIDHRQQDAAEVGFTLKLTGLLTLTLRLMGISARAPMEVEIRVDVDVQTFAPLIIRLLPHRVTGKSIRVNAAMPSELRALPTALLDRLNPLVLAVRESIVREVNAQLARPELQALATIDVLKLAGAAMEARN